MKTWKKGDRAWRGYARHYGNPKEWWPEIRPLQIVDVRPDGELRCHMEGIMPGAEGRRNPGSWVALNLEPDLLHDTPQAALSDAIAVAAAQNAALAEQEEVAA